MALQVGSRAFSEPEYAQARDALLDRMRETGRERPLYRSMLSRADRGQPANVRWSVRYDDVFRFAAVYGQTCAFIGNTEELDKVRDWAGAVLARQGDDGGKLFQRYQYRALRDALRAAGGREGARADVRRPAARRERPRPDADRQAPGKFTIVLSALWRLSRA